MPLAFLSGSAGAAAVSGQKTATRSVALRRERADRRSWLRMPARAIGPPARLLSHNPLAGVYVRAIRVHTTVWPDNDAIALLTSLS
jgi:hypothetical protein